MTDRDSSQLPTGDSNGPSFASSPETPLEQQGLCRSRLTNSDEPVENPRQLAKEVHWLQHATFWSQVGLGIIGIAALFIYGCQLNVMKHTNELTQQALDGSDATLQATLSKMQLQADAMNRLADKAGLQAEKLDSSVKQASRLAEAAERANRNVLEADRPWFGIALAAQDPLEIGKIPSATVTFTNSGRRPARVITSEETVGWFVSLPKDPPFKVFGVRSTDMIVPNAGLTSRFNLFTAPVTQFDIDTANSGATNLYIYANIEYIDIRTKATHFSHACWVYVGNNSALARAFYNCAEYQDAD